jgi:cell division septum initiation protein DivIVA
MTSVVSDIGTGGAKRFSDEQVNEFLDAIKADNAKLRAEKVDLEAKIGKLEEELRRERDQNELLRLAAVKAEREAKERWENVQGIVNKPPQELPTFGRRALTLDDD